MASQSSVGSVRDRLPTNCTLNLDDDDEDTLDLVTSVQDRYFAAASSIISSDLSDEEDEIDWRQEDQDQFANIHQFKQSGCGCSRLYDRPCCQEVGIELIETTRLATAELTKEELDLVILAQLSQYRSSTATTKQTGQERKRSSLRYVLCGKEICKTTYLFSHGIGEKRLKHLCKHYDSNGLVPRRHGNKGKIRFHATSVADEQNVVNFIRNYADIHGLPLPGRMPKMRDYTVMMLPSDRSKAQLWREYVESCDSADTAMTPVGISKFYSIWKQYLPDIAVMKIASDLCDTCQNNNSLIMRSANCDEKEKSARLQQQEHHLKLATECRGYYKSQCQDATDYWNSLTEIERSGTLEGPIHISFDYAQNLLYPHSPQQVGPIYFKTLKKCTVFGVCNEHLPRQVNYLIDESDLTGKGANETVSYLNHYLENYVNKTKLLNVHCDNCGGQNKNNYVMQYMCWRVMTVQNDKIEVSFMLAYHTRFGPDWCFGLLKLKYRKSYISSIAQLADAVQSSTTKNINIPHLVRDTSTHELVVKIYDWKNFFSGVFTTIPNLSQYRHFTFKREVPGCVFVREFPSSPEICVRMLKTGREVPRISSSPVTIPPPGLSAERAWYLYDNVRRHCEEQCKDVSCPKPSVAKPSKSDSAMTSSTEKGPKRSACNDTHQKKSKSKGKV